MANIKENLKKKMKESDLSSSKLSEVSGEKFTFIKSILNGRAQNPGAFAMLSLARSLNCSVEELLTGDPSGTTDNHKDYPIENYKLFLDGASMLAGEIERCNVIIPQSKFIKSCNEIYQYALRKGWKKIDIDFVEWYLEKSL